MGFTSITTYSYRNLHDQKVLLNARRIFLVGENGQGKSNFLEAVYLLSYGSSFRTKRENELITHGSREMSLHGLYIRPEEDDIEGSIALKLGAAVSAVPNTSSVDSSTRSSAGGPQASQINQQADQVNQKRQASQPNNSAGGSKEKVIELDGKRVQDRKQLISHIPAIVFSHDDIYFVNGPPERRRWFFNQTMSLFDPMFIDTLRDYRKILKMRNLAQKEQRSDLIPIYDQQLAVAGLEIQRRRAAVIEEFNQVVAPIFEEVSTISEPLSIEYRPSWPKASSSSSDSSASHYDQVLTHLAQKREQDLLYGTTSSGPHRDRFVFRLAGSDFARIASTGQLRLMSLILRIGQCRYFSQKTGRRPILLLDDVLLELDGERRTRFLAQLPDYEQAFFTFLPDEKYLELAKRAERTEAEKANHTGDYVSGEKAGTAGNTQHTAEQVDQAEKAKQAAEAGVAEPEQTAETAVYWVENGWIQKMETTHNKDRTTKMGMDPTRNKN